MNTKHTTKEESDAWKKLKLVKPRIVRLTPGDRYNPPPKPPSRKDRRRLAGKLNKAYVQKMRHAHVQ